ncbi:MAG: lipopolysaccharide assembly protein LapA domain-containing protein [Gemmatimonadota bacterium]
MKALSMILLTVAVIFFAGQNLDSVEVVFLFWRFYVPLSLITLVPLLVGLLIGLAGAAVVIKRREHKAEAAREPDQLQAPPVEVEAGAEIKDSEEIPG